ncbi:MAG TPA: BTAD domain-containing putative transcriptional regulator [Pseudonocardiaceae bacterium]|jgi:DNA-binding SARP family transcriptional activator
MRFCVLGSLEARSGDQRLSLGGTRAECVVAMLLLEANHMVPVSRLVSAAWPDQQPTTATHQVRKIISGLRQRLPDGSDLITTDGVGYRLVLEPDQLDLSMFELRLRRAREAELSGQRDDVLTQLQAAVELWRGPALSGLDTEVLRAAAAALDERRSATEDRLTELRLARGAARELVADLRRRLSEHPLRETTQGHLMLALYQSGRQADALEVYDQSRRLLVDELGIDPGPDLTRLHEQILRNDPSLISTAHDQFTVADPELGPPKALPYDIPDFVGRADELAQIFDRVRDNIGHGLTIAAIDGMPGVGKTSVILHAAHLLTGQFPDGQLFIDLHGFTPGQEPMTPEAALEVLLCEIGVPHDRIPDDLTARAALWRAEAAGRKLLLLLDNAFDTRQVRPLLPGTPGSLVLITSRARLTSLDGILPLSLAPPSQEDGMQLLRLIIGTDRVEREIDAARDLVSACGCLPLAIRIVSTRLLNRPQWSIEHMVERMHRAGRRMHELSVDDRSVAVAIKLSYDALSQDQQRIFRLLGMLPGAEFDVHAVAAIAGLPVRQAELLLEDLLDTRLIGQRVLDRYSLHDIVHSVARDIADATEPERNRAVAWRRLFDYYMRVADTAASLIQPGRAEMNFDYEQPPADVPALPDADAAMRWFDVEHATLLAAVRAAQAAGLDQHACHLPRALAYYLQLRGRMADLDQVLRIAVAAARRLGDPLMEGRTLINLSIPYWHFGRLQEALDCAEQALAIAEQEQDVLNTGMCYGRIGMLLNSLGQYEEALSYHRLALRAYRKTGRRQEQSRTLASVSVAHSALGQYEDALHAALRAGAIDRDTGDTGSQVISLVNVANARIGMREFDQALGVLADTLSLARSIGSPNGEAVTLARLAEAYRRLGRYDDALDAGARSLRILWAIERPAIAAAVENTLGLVYQACGEYDLALSRHRQAHTLADQVSFRIELARALDGMAHAQRQLGNPAAAAENLQLAVKHYEEMGVPEAESARRELESVCR